MPDSAPTRLYRGAESSIARSDGATTRRSRYTDRRTFIMDMAAASSAGGVGFGEFHGPDGHGVVPEGRGGGFRGGSGFRGGGGGIRGGGGFRGGGGASRG